MSLFMQYLYKKDKTITGVFQMQHIASSGGKNRFLRHNDIFNRHQHHYGGNS